MPAEAPRPERDERARFMAKVEPDLNSGCWLWTGTVNRRGYGMFYASGGRHHAHRYLWEEANGQIPNGLIMLHRCDTPSCVNPDHVRPGSYAENNADMKAKGRYCQGELRPEAKLTANDVRIIRTRRAAGESSAQVARDYPVCAPVIRQITRRLIWKHVA